MNAWALWFELAVGAVSLYFLALHYAALQRRQLASARNGRR